MCFVFMDLRVNYLMRMAQYIFSYVTLTLTLQMWRIWLAPNNASRWQMGFNLALKGLIQPTPTPTHPHPHPPTHTHPPTPTHPHTQNLVSHFLFFYFCTSILHVVSFFRVSRQMCSASDTHLILPATFP